MVFELVAVVVCEFTPIGAEVAIDIDTSCPLWPPLPSHHEGTFMSSRSGKSGKPPFCSSGAPSVSSANSFKSCSGAEVVQLKSMSSRLRLLLGGGGGEGPMVVAGTFGFGGDGVDERSEERGGIIPGVVVVPAEVVGGIVLGGGALPGPVPGTVAVIPGAVLPTVPGVGTEPDEDAVLGDSVPEEDESSSRDRFFLSSSGFEDDALFVLDDADTRFVLFRM